MTGQRFSLVCLLCLVCLAPAPALVAQETGPHPAAERGRRSIVLDIDGGPQIGFWTRRTDRTDLGLDLGLNAYLRDDLRQLSIAVTPGIKRYLTSVAPLAPYVYFGLPLNYTRQDDDNVGTPDNTRHAVGVGGQVGFGLEWFPVTQVSIGGHVGFRTHYQSWDDDFDDTLQLGTMSSGARVHLYF
jgi:hypothetical protein